MPLKEREVMSITHLRHIYSPFASPRCVPFFIEWFGSHFNLVRFDSGSTQSNMDLVHVVGLGTIQYMFPMHNAWWSDGSVVLPSDLILVGLCLNGRPYNCSQQHAACGESLHCQSTSPEINPSPSIAEVWMKERELWWREREEMFRVVDTLRKEAEGLGGENERLRDVVFGLWQESRSAGGSVNTGKSHDFGIGDVDMDEARLPVPNGNEAGGESESGASNVQGQRGKEQSREGEGADADGEFCGFVFIPGKVLSWLDVQSFSVGSMIPSLDPVHVARRFLNINVDLRSKWGECVNWLNGLIIASCP